MLQRDLVREEKGQASEGGVMKGNGQGNGKGRKEKERKGRIRKESD